MAHDNEYEAQLTSGTRSGDLALGALAALTRTRISPSLGWGSGERRGSRDERRQSFALTIEAVRAAALPPEIAAIRIGAAGRRQLDRGDPAALLLAGGHAILASVESGPATDEFEAPRAIAQQFRAASPSN